MQRKKNRLMSRYERIAENLNSNNVFSLLGAYPVIGNEYFNSYPDGRPFYNRMQYGLINDPGYCAYADMHLLAHPEIAFDQMNFLTDYAKNGKSLRLSYNKNLVLGFSSQRWRSY